MSEVTYEKRMRPGERNVNIMIRVLQHPYLDFENCKIGIVPYVAMMPGGVRLVLDLGGDRHRQKAATLW
jgi:hypothetical protein